MNIFISKRTGIYSVLFICTLYTETLQDACKDGGVHSTRNAWDLLQFQFDVMLSTISSYSFSSSIVSVWIYVASVECFQRYSHTHTHILVQSNN